MGTSHAKHVLLAIQSAAMANRDLFPRKYDTALPSRDLVLRKYDALGLSLALLVGGGTLLGLGYIYIYSLFTNSIHVLKCKHSQVR